MNLWHGTYEENKDKIIKSGVLKNNLTSDDTKIINNIIIESLGCNPRTKCIYFSGDTESADGYDYAFKIDTNQLELDKLFVGDYSLINDMLELYLEHNSKESQSFLIDICEKYKRTLVPFKCYLENFNNYLNRDIWDLEFLYFGEVFVSEYNLD